jgi:hypothetical protein
MRADVGPMRRGVLLTLPEYGSRRSPMYQPPHPNIEQAKTKTEEVQRELEVASAELGLTHGALEREIPKTVKEKSDVAWAIRQNAELERKVQQAAEDLEQVAELLEQARGA